MDKISHNQQPGQLDFDTDKLGRDMENTVDKVEVLFRKAESDLEYMSRKLEDEFREQLGSNNQLNPCEMMQRLQRVKKEYNSLVQDAEGIKAMQSEMATYFKTQLQTACTAIKALQENAPQAQISDSSEQEAAVEAVLGLRRSEQGDHDDTSGKQETHHSSEQKSSGREQSTSHCAVQEPTHITQAEQRARNSGFTEISEDEFESVSPLVKGRVKLTDVNTVYRSLFEHFKTQRNKEPLTIQEMTKKGLRITGATGEAKLKVMRALKIVHIAKSGAVKLL
ncbi:spindle and kinetochore-associated protein 2-like [Asterias rubens]|uniref:spindle and kinetochore-associated protein 2-like n=1 Tax=Asterias rubens TaxID=7604 RepID=UPI00145592DF|nr:spindle and kinetochore-associated protein 2-like [Asterias rubens]XP_033626980.1 spindle and kinetochore-associated protein 2-like [Asterias rubens]